jgi:cytoskeletal protein RodZ
MTDVMVDERETETPAAPHEDLLIRRNGALFATVALLSAVVALAYVWRGLQGSLAGWVVVGVLAAISLVHLRGWLDARTPLLVADPRGVRVRLGRSWTGYGWDEVADIQVQPRKHLLSDGRILVRLLTGAAYEVRIGAISASSRQDLGRALLALADGRTTVLAPEADSRGADNHVRPAPPAVVVGPSVESDAAVAARIVEPRRKPSGASPARPSAAADSPRRRAVRADVRRGTTVTASALAQSTPGERAEIRLPEQTQVRGTESRVGLVLEHVGSPDPVEVTPYAMPVATDAPAPVELPADPVIGPQLAQARNRLRVSVDQIADRTRIRPHVIEAMEVDDFTPCGGDFYARGHLRRLASVLGIDPDPLVQEYDARYAQGPISASAVFSAELASGPGAAVRGTRGGPNWTALLGVVVALMVLWGAAQWVTGDEATPLRTPSAQQPSTSPEPDPDRFDGIGTKPRPVSVRVAADTVVRVEDESGAAIWMGRMQAGESRRWPVTGEVTVRARNASAVTAQLGSDEPVVVGSQDAPDEVTLGKS